jgi:hypothetical protein
MRRTILPFVEVLLVVALVAPTAAAVPKEPKGCPADASIWTPVAYVPPPADPATYMATSFWQFYFVDTGGGAQLIANTGWTDVEAYEWLIGLLDAGVDKNADDQLCAWWIGGLPGQDDSFLSVVDNNASAPH